MDTEKELKAKIDEVALEMIDRTKQLEAKYLPSLNAISVETNKTLEIEIKETEEAFRNPTISN
jgi:CHASE3 domain sensor protein